MHIILSAGLGVNARLPNRGQLSAQMFPLLRSRCLSADPAAIATRYPSAHLPRSSLPCGVGVAAMQMVPQPPGHPFGSPQARTPPEQAGGVHMMMGVGDPVSNPAID